MDANVIALVGGGLVSIAAILWLVVGRISDKDKAADSRVAQAVTEELLHQKEFELEQTEQALARQTARADALEKEFADGIVQPVNTDLAPDDVKGRVLRVLQAWRASDGTAPAVPVAPSNEPPKA